MLLSESKLIGRTVENGEHYSDLHALPDGKIWQVKPGTKTPVSPMPLSISFDDFAQWLSDFVDEGNDSIFELLPEFAIGSCPVWEVEP